jgi:hypothetical protein
MNPEPDFERILAEEQEKLRAERPGFSVLDDDRYRLSLPQIGVVLEVDRLRRERNELVGELRVRCALPGARTVDGNLSIADFNLSSARARSERARLLAERANTRDVDWIALIEELCQRVLQCPPNLHPVSRGGAAGDAIMSGQEVTYAFDFRPAKLSDRQLPLVGDSIPRIARLMALAFRFEELLREKKIRNYAELARRGRVTRARMTQIMKLLNLTPDIQEQILFLRPVKGLNERNLRRIVRQIDWDEQRSMFQKLITMAGDSD